MYLLPFQGREGGGGLISKYCFCSSGLLGNSSSGDLPAEQSVESPEAGPQLSMATPTEEEDTRPTVLTRGEWRKVLDASWSVTSMSSVTCPSN